MKMEEDDRFFTPSREWEMVNGSNKQDEEDFSVFPPSHHENLHLHLHPHEEHQEEKSRFTQIKLFDVNEEHQAQPQQVSRLGVTRDTVKMKFKIGFEIIWSKILYVFNLVRFRRGKRLFGSVAGVTVAMMACLWYFKWRKLTSGDDKIDRIMVLVQGQDEKITQLLNQISYLNDLLSARHSIPVLRSG